MDESEARSHSQGVFREVGKKFTTLLSKTRIWILPPFRSRSTTPSLVAYNIYGATCTEVELDVLTGEREILRTDILNDCGQR